MDYRICFFLFFVLLVGSNCAAQSSDVEFLIGKIKNDYAGYYDKTSDAKFDVQIEKILKKERDTFKILSHIVDYFHDQHLQVSAVNILEKKIIDTLLCYRNFKFVKEYFENTKILKDKIEGYWINDYHTIVMAIVRESKGIYKGYLMETDINKMPFGFPIAEIEHVTNGKYMINYLGIRGGNQAFFRSIIKGDSIIKMGDVATWKKTPIRPLSSLKGSRIDDVFISGALLDKDNYLLTLPSFRASNIGIIDSIIKRDYKKISSSGNLIIDIRDNTGGRVKCYESLTPFVYTNPIVGISGYTRCTKDLIKHKEEGLYKFLQNPPIDSVTLLEIKKDINNIEEHVGAFFFESGDTVRLDSVKAYPKNVAIIANYSCESAAEMMLLDFKQSKKVTIFGEHTMGAVDYLDIYRIELPSKKYWLSLATVKRSIPKNGKKLDGIGIYPDVNISDNIPYKQWVDFVIQYYKRQN